MMKHDEKSLPVRKNISVLGSNRMNKNISALGSRPVRNRASLFGSNLAMLTPSYLAEKLRASRTTSRSRRTTLGSEDGSISVVVIGLFVITVASLMVMTDVSALIVAKRSLVQATEAAAQRGVHTLDKSEYYQGKANMFTAPMALATNREHPSIPIDCTRGGVEVLLELNSWSNDESDMKWQQLKGIQLTDFSCDGASLEISTRSEMKLPFKLPFTSTDSVFLTATAGTTNKVQEGFYLFGIRVH
jgi:hypothetical protein